MRFLYHTCIFFSITLPIVWLNILLTSVLNTSLFFYGAIILFSVCGLRKREAIFCNICLGVLIDSINFETHLWGLSALLLSGPVVLFQGNAWRNVFRYRTFTWSISLNVILQILFVWIHFLFYGVPIGYLKNYFLSFTISAIVASVLGKLLLKFRQNQLL